MTEDNTLHLISYTDGSLLWRALSSRCWKEVGTLWYSVFPCNPQITQNARTFVLLSFKCNFSVASMTVGLFQVDGVEKSDEGKAQLKKKILMRKQWLQGLVIK